MKILIAEDDPVSVKILQFTLEHYGHEVIAAANGTEAWEKFDAEPVRVIVSDWMMPGLDGLQLCHKIRARPQTDYTYFILLTAIHTGRDNLRQAMDAGIDDFLANTPAVLAEARAALARQAAPELERAAHTLKGSCSNFGAEPMRAACQRLEEAARSGPLAQAPAMLAAVEREFAFVRLALEREHSLCAA